MWIIRKLSPWQEKDKLYPIGNPPIFASDDEGVVWGKKIDLEIEQLRNNPIPNLWEYWDVECSKEMIRLNNYLIENHQFPILEIQPENEDHVLDMSEIKHGLYPDDRFSDSDLLKMQNFIGIYYYKVVELNEAGKYLIIINPKAAVDINSIEYQLFDSEQEAKDYLENKGLKKGIEIIEINS